MSGKVYKIGYKNVKNVDRETRAERGRWGNALLKNEQYLDASSYITVFTAKVISTGKYFPLVKKFHNLNDMSISSIRRSTVYVRPTICARVTDSHRT
jgi:hypothetical protein